MLKKCGECGFTVDTALDHNCTPPTSRLDATTVARAFEVMLPVSEGGIAIERNPHLNLVTWVATDETGDTFEPVTAKDYIKGEVLSYVGPVEQQKIEETNELWIFTFREPGDKAETKLAAASLPALAAWLQNHGLAFGS